MRMKILFLTVSDRNFFPGTLAAVNSILEFHDDVDIAVVSSGVFNEPLTEPQRVLLSRGGIKVFDHSFFNLPGRVLGAWQLKAYAASDLADGYDILVGFDSDLIFCGSVSDVITKSIADGKIRGGQDGDGEVYDLSYSVYGITLGAKNSKYFSTSCYFCPITEANRRALKEWARASNRAEYGPQQDKVYPGHGDQGLLNAVVFSQTQSENVELLSNSLWSQHWRYEQDVIGFDGQHFLNYSDGSSRMRAFHCGGSNKFWTVEHSLDRETKGQCQRWPYALFLNFLFLGKISDFTYDPLLVIPDEFSHLFADAVNYYHLIKTINPQFASKWENVSWRWIDRCCTSNSIRRFMTLNGNGSMDQYAKLARSLPRGATCVEIGSFVGGSIVTLGLISLDRDLNLISVESFMGNGDGKMDGGDLPQLHEYQRNVKVTFPYLNIVSIPLPSNFAAKCFDDRSLDMVFIDADHSTKNVIEDISLWLPKVKPGGIIAGDDYEWESVAKAVVSIFGESHHCCNSIWWKRL